MSFGHLIIIQDLIKGL